MKGPLVVGEADSERGEHKTEDLEAGYHVEVKRLKMCHQLFRLFVHGF